MQVCLRSLETSVPSPCNFYRKGAQNGCLTAGKEPNTKFYERSLKLHRLEKVFITHLHGDHIFGLPGLLSSRSFHGAPSPLQVYGPPGLRSFVECALSISSTHLTYPVEWVEVRPGVVWSDERFEVRCELLDHVVPSYGYRVTERDKPGALRSDALKALGVPPGPIYGTLKAGGRVVLENGTVLDGREFLESAHSRSHTGDSRRHAAVRICTNVGPRCRRACTRVHISQ